MAITRANTHVFWGSSEYAANVTVGGSNTSTAFSLDATCIAAQISLKADNITTPASDDIVYVWLLQSGGDPDAADTAAEYDTSGYGGLLLAVLDTSLGDDPIGMTVPLPIPQESAKLYAEGVTAGSTNNVAISAIITEQRAA
jgi:hypothetical protein